MTLGEHYILLFGKFIFVVGRVVINKMNGLIYYLTKFLPTNGFEKCNLLLHQKYTIFKGPAELSKIMFATKVPPGNHNVKVR